jgi:hypothetical protein
MQLEDITLALFAACNGLRIAAYVPQIRRAAADSNGAAAISATTWFLFLLANITTIVHVLITANDRMLAACFAANAACCTAILSIVCWKRYRHGLTEKNRTTSDAWCIDQHRQQMKPRHPVRT